MPMCELVLRKVQMTERENERLLEVLKTVAKNIQESGIEGLNQSYTNLERNKEDLKSIIAHYGITSQLTMCLEEMSELAKEICKHQRGANNRVAIMEEVADVLVTIEQVKLIFNIEDDVIQTIIDNKIKRTLNRMEREVEE